MHVPEGWKKAKLAEKLAVLKDGTHFSPQSKSGPFMYLTSKNIRFGRLDIENVSYITEEEHQKIYKGSPVKYGDILLTKDGANTGNAAINSLDFDFSLLSSVAFLRGKPGFLLNDYLLHLLLSTTGQSAIKSEMAGQAITRLTLQKIGGLIFLFPPINEQHKIAKILSTWDKAIEKLEALIAAKQKRKKALMQQLLTGKKRFAGFGGEWKKVSLRKLGKCIRGVSYKPEQILSIETDDSIRLLRSTNIQNRSLNDKELVIIPSSLVNDSQVLKDGDLAVCMANGSKSLVGKSAPFKIQESKYTVGAFCAVFRPNQDSNNEFIKFLFQSDVYSKELTILLSGSSINNLKGSDVEGIKFYIPYDKCEQQIIASVLSAADTEIENHQKQLAALKEQKKGLMQQLLTGKKRVTLSLGVSK